MKTSWTDEQVSSVICDRMNPKVYSGSGGEGKIDFLTMNKLTPKKFQIPGNPTLRDLLEALCSLVAARHRERPSMQDNPFVDQNLNPERKFMGQEELDRAVETHEKALKHL